MNHNAHVHGNEHMQQCGSLIFFLLILVSRITLLLILVFKQSTGSSTVHCRLVYSNMKSIIHLQREYDILKIGK